VSGRWFRLYASIRHDPKVQRLPLKARWALLMMWTLASENDGVIPEDHLDYELGMRPCHVKEVVNLLVGLTLLERVGDKLMPHNWRGRQYLSDNSTARTQKYRATRMEAGLGSPGDYSRFRPALITRDGEACIYCSSTDNLCVDHMVPIVQGGTDHIDNLALACKACNSGKSGRTPDQAKYKIKVLSAKQAYIRYAGTVPVTPPETETETETETEQKEKKVKASGDALPVKEAFEAYNLKASSLGLAQAKVLTPGRATKLRARLEEHGLEGWKEALAAIERQPFLLGRNDRAWRVNLDFLLQTASLNKVREGAYSDEGRAETVQETAARLVHESEGKNGAILDWVQSLDGGGSIEIRANPSECLPALSAPRGLRGVSADDG
jgi:hypothetical protein